MELTKGSLAWLVVQARTVIPGESTKKHLQELIGMYTAVTNESGRARSILNDFNASNLAP